MQPANLDLTVYKGSTFSKLIQWKTGTPAEPVNLTGCTARMQIRKSVNSSEILDTLTTENGKLSIYDPVLGKLRIDIEHTVSTSYTFTGGVYDLEIIYPSEGPVYRILEGCFAAIPEVTR
jgi:hypothetical protein